MVDKTSIFLIGLIFTTACVNIRVNQPIHNVSEGGYCALDEDCAEGLFCENKKCINKNIFENFSSCNLSSDCTEKCTFCKTKTKRYICMISSEEFKTNK